MTKTTPPPCRNILELIPELEALAKTTVRLHPRRGEVPQLDASKIGGMLLWPQDEPWPRCDEAGPPDWEYPVQWLGPEGAHGPLVPVLQLRQDDFPELEFHPGTDLFQLLWCPIDHNVPIYVAKAFAFWRKASDVANPRLNAPEPELAGQNYVPNECRLLPERVLEFPSVRHLPDEWVVRIENWHLPDPPNGPFDEALLEDGLVDLYEWELSTCPSSKVGGHVHWVQEAEIPSCTCGADMEHLLTLTDSECDGGTYRRWLPLEDRAVWEVETVAEGERLDLEISAIGLDNLGGGYLYIFVCRKCSDWPIRTVYQR